MKTKFRKIPALFLLAAVSLMPASVLAEEIRPTPPADMPKTEIFNLGQGIPIENLSKQMGADLFCGEDGFVHLRSESAPKIVVNGKSLNGKADLSLPVRCRGDKYYLDFLK